MTFVHCHGRQILVRRGVFRCEGVKQLRTLVIIIMCYVSLWAQKEMPSSGPIGLALVTPEKAKHFYSHGLRLVRLTYFTQMGLAGLIRLNMPTAQLGLSVIAFVTKPLNFQPPQKVMQQFYSGPYFGPTNTNHTKNYQKITFGALFRIPPKMHYSALQCSAMD